MIGSDAYLILYIIQVFTDHNIDCFLLPYQVPTIKNIRHLRFFRTTHFLSNHHLLLQ
jgi:hypothetical protein